MCLFLTKYDIFKSHIWTKKAMDLEFPATYVGDNGKILELSRFSRKVTAQTKLSVLAVLQAGREGG